ncbi:hypothetical protein F5B19DRAFT_288221 [Rostrohypoxylon terebratum]|nr:hypothetical protein F5B19DRAFT_288221 [Rostrohypoxylon terebratum]
MDRTPVMWGRIGNGGFAPVPQIDAVDDYDDGDQPQRRVTRAYFSNQIQQVLRRDARERMQEQDSDHRSIQGSIHSSPALSDTTLTEGDYLDVPIRHDETSQGDCIEYYGHYGPEVASRSPTPSIKASAGLEVVANTSDPPHSSYGYLYIDDPSNDLSYRGSEGKVEDEDCERPNYKPPVLGRNFLITLFLILVIFVALAELAIQLMPNDSGNTGPSEAPNGTVEIRARSMFDGRIGLPSPMVFFKRQNNTGIGNPAPETTTSITLSTETVSGTISTTAGNELTTESSLTSTSTSTSDIPTLPGGDVSTDTTETSVPSISIPTTSQSLETSLLSSPSPSPSTSATSLINPPAPPTSVTLPLPPQPPIPTPSTSEAPPTLPEISSSTLYTAPTFPPTKPGHHEPSPTVTSSPGDEVPTSWSLPTSDPSTSIVNPGGPMIPVPPISSTVPIDPPSPTSLPGPPSSETTHPDSPPAGSTRTFPIETIPSITPPTSIPNIPTTMVPFPTETLPTQTPPDEPGSDASTSSTSLSFSSPMQSYSTTSSPADATTTPQSSTSSTSSSSPENEPSSTSPDPLTEQPSPSTSSPFSSSSISSHTTLTHLIGTNIPSPSTPEPFATITVTPDTRPPPPPITTTIVTSISKSGEVPVESTIISVLPNIAKGNANNAIIDFVTTYKDSHGNPTKTSTILAQASSGTSLVYLYNPYQTTLTDFQGVATKTEDYYISMSTCVLYDENGRPTATQTSSIMETLSFSTLFDGGGVATKTLTELIPMSSTIYTMVTLPTAAVSTSKEKSLHVVPISDGKYFLGLMFPTLIAIMLSIPIRIMDQTAKLYQPFHALMSSPEGTKACDTLCFPIASTWSLAARFRALLNGQPLLTLTGLLVLGSVIMIPLSSEAVGIFLEGPDCATTKGDTYNCSMRLGVYSERAQTAFALLIIMAILVGLVMIVLRKWNTGVKKDPWSLSHLLQLSVNSEFRNLVWKRLGNTNHRVSNRRMNEAFEGMLFLLDYWKDNGKLKYSLLISNIEPERKRRGKKRTNKNKEAIQDRKGDNNAMYFFVLSWTGRLLFLGLLCGVVVGLLVYTITGDGQGYVQFMMGRWRVVRFIFTFIGVLISLIWDFVFQAVAFLSPYKLLNRRRPNRVVGDVIEMIPPANAFSGLRSSIIPDRRDTYLGIVSFTSIISGVLPLLLSIALDKCTETFWAHTVCLWMAISLLGIMILTVAGSFFVEWPHMPMDPSTIAGGIYYTLDRYLPCSPSAGLLV